jgi:hypothetical protein
MTPERVIARLRGGIIRRLGVESPVSFCYTARKLR